MSAFPPNYTEIFATRQQRLLRIQKDPSLIIGAIAYYENHPIEFITHWCITYDPRNASQGMPTVLPFILFQRQRELVKFLLECLDDQENALVDKSRDMGATWVCCALSVWLWLFRGGTSIGWGSRKEQLVDRIGDPDSIFEKMRMLIDYLPRWLWPAGFKAKEHLSYMKIINPETGSTITGEAGDNIGRGGRKALYFKDESAHYEHAESIEAALGDNTNVQVDISTVHGTANLFHRKRQAGVIWDGGKIERGVTRIFILDWRDHPLKTPEWYDLRRGRAEAEGLLHIFAQEVDRDSSASIEGIIIPAAWIRAAIDAHTKLGFTDTGKVIAGLDVADEGGDKNALGVRKGSVLKHISAWAEGDTGQTADKAIAKAKEMKVTELEYDCIGVGAGVKAEINRLRREGILSNGLSIIPWNAATSPLFPKAKSIIGDPDSIINKDLFANLKAQAWWMLRGRFEKTYKAITKGIKYDSAELISIPADLGNRDTLATELSQPTYKYDGKCRIIVDKKPSGAKSPNMADAVVMAFWPIQKREVRSLLR
jgi:hypothetical protein